MSNLYSLYLAEKEDKETLEIPEVGFITYKVLNKVCHICIIYVAPEHRNVTNARTLVKAIHEKVQGRCEAFTAVCNTAQNNTTNTMKILLHFGFEVVGVERNDILLYKDLR